MNLLTVSALLWCAGLTFVRLNVLEGMTPPNVVRRAPCSRLNVVLTRWNMPLWLIMELLGPPVEGARLFLHCPNSISVELIPGVG